MTKERSVKIEDVEATDASVLADTALGAEAILTFDGWSVNRFLYRGPSCARSQAIMTAAEATDRPAFDAERMERAVEAAKRAAESAPRELWVVPDDGMGAAGYDHKSAYGLSIPHVGRVMVVSETAFAKIEQSCERDGNGPYDANVTGRSFEMKIKRMTNADFLPRNQTVAPPSSPSK